MRETIGQLCVQLPASQEARMYGIHGLETWFPFFQRKIIHSIFDMASSTNRLSSASRFFVGLFQWNWIWVRAISLHYSTQMPLFMHNGDTRNSWWKEFCNLRFQIKFTVLLFDHSDYLYRLQWFIVWTPFTLLPSSMRASQSNNRSTNELKITIWNKINKPIIFKSV